jgi:Fur family transcriptional regulator, peroxide stress response regulator
MPAEDTRARGQVHGAMLEPQLAEQQLRQHGARMTAQRHAVLEILSGNRTHPTVEELVAEVRERLGCVSPATIYNTLDTLVKLGFVRRIEGLEQKAHFDPDTSEHEHAICLQCRTVWDVGSAAAAAEVPDGFTVLNTLIQGICGHCAHNTQ